MRKWENPAESEHVRGKSGELGAEWGDKTRQPSNPLPLGHLF